MKNILKIASILVLAITMISCEEDLIIFDNQGGQTIYQFDLEGTTFELPRDNATFEFEGNIDVPISSTTLSNVDRTITVELVEDSTQIEDLSLITFNENVVIPAGEYSGDMSVTIQGEEGVDLDLFETYQIAFKIIATEGGNNAVVEDRVQFLNAQIVCPVDETFFTGDYQITQLAGFNAFEPFLYDGQTTTIEANGLTRTFEIDYLGFPWTFNVRLNCDLLEVSGAPSSGGNVGCGGGGITQGTPATPAQYDVTMGDDSIILTLVDFQTDGGCGVAPTPITIQLDKI
ncbi:hypothetical protein [Psychroflexus sp. ALD_RP9]|uniref:hypothetical protein n=1 Tax=Psychroflexus sp. ALD_RP9 TaxID=2777186 RepID=UPI001A8E5D8C|nr:hypothetical protein [Psychroflexus sp. ALD_RP9]QSS97757.1 hypothetical protein IMZ30_03325 [Psychroflexus sp. ALD_RP9]